MRPAPHADSRLCYSALTGAPPEYASLLRRGSSEFPPFTHPRFLDCPPTFSDCQCPTPRRGHHRASLRKRDMTTAGDDEPCAPRTPPKRVCEGEPHLDVEGSARRVMHNGRGRGVLHRESCVQSVEPCLRATGCWRWCTGVCWVRRTGCWRPGGGRRRSRRMWGTGIRDWLSARRLVRFHTGGSTGPRRLGTC